MIEKNLGMSLPIIFIHEGDNEYLKYAICSAEKYNDEVYLLGDESNKDFCGKWINADELESEAYHMFEKRYIHLSSNSYWFELISIKRYFVLLEFLKTSGYERCIMMDSDVLVYADFSKLKELENCNVAMCMNKKHCGPSTFYCTKSALDDFTAFICDTYNNNADVLRDMYKPFKDSGTPGGISDMTLLYLWSKGRNDVFDWALASDYIVTNNMNVYENYIKMDKLLKVKKVVFRKGMPYCYDMADRMWKPAIALHFQGRAKVLMKDFYMQEGYIKRLYTKIWSSRKILRYFFPTDFVPRNSKIAIWGGGKVGKSYYRQLRISRYAEVCVWVDKNWQSMKNKKIVSPNELKNVEIDYVVIAIASRHIATGEVMRTIEAMELNNVQIIWRRP